MNNIVQKLLLCYSNSGDIMAKVNRNIDLIILSILNVNDCYGYEIVKLAKEISGGSIIIKEGALYPIFYRLLKMNYISSYNETIQNRTRVYYKIEALRKEYLYEAREKQKQTILGTLAILKYGEGEKNDE